MTPSHTALIAIVDDDDAVRDSLALLLRLHGFATREFASGEAFLKWAGTEPADCVLLDLRMAGLSGIDVQGELARRRLGLANRDADRARRRRDDASGAQGRSLRLHREAVRRRVACANDSRSDAAQRRAAHAVRARGPLRPRSRAA
jgi:CheY-like chemotaxis protein